jgi:hypothetical protein
MHDYFIVPWTLLVLEGTSYPYPTFRQRVHTSMLSTMRLGMNYVKSNDGDYPSPTAGLRNRSSGSQQNRTREFDALIELCTNDHVLCACCSAAHMHSQHSQGPSSRQSRSFPRMHAFILTAVVIAS